MNAILFLIALVVTERKISAAPVLVDRLIVEISGKSYSQKQLEVYHLLRTIAVGDDVRKGLPSEANWAQVLESFKNEMIVITQLENDQTKLDSFLPDTAKLDAAHKAVLDRQNKDKDVDTFLRQRALTDSDIHKVLTMIFRVEGYARSRLQLSSARTIDEQGPDFIQLDPALDWFQALQKATAYRFYLQAKTYQSLAPLR